MILRKNLQGSVLHRANWDADFPTLLIPSETPKENLSYRSI